MHGSRETHVSAEGRLLTGVFTVVGRVVTTVWRRYLQTRAAIDGSPTHRRERAPENKGQDVCYLSVGVPLRDQIYRASLAHQRPLDD